jgi:putative PIG3 family NAD(P)H quinone oxidoreductase
VKAIVFVGAGGPEVIQVQVRPDPVPHDDQVLVRARFAALNPADVAQREGRYPPPPGAPADIPGLEVAGTVQECGKGVLGWRPGDRVFGLVGGGGLADRVVVHERHVCAIPETLDERGAAAVPEAFITAHDAAIVQGNLRPGESFLVHGASGGVGTAACQLGVSLGARVFGCVRSSDGAQLVEELGAQPVHESEFVSVLQGQGGADVILELVGAPHLSGNLEALAPKGRIVIVSTAAGSDAQIPLATLMGKRVTIRGTVLRARSLEEKALAVALFAREVVPLFSAGRARPIIDSSFPVDEVAAAFARLEGHGKRGKVLLDFEPSGDAEPDRA